MNQSSKFFDLLVARGVLDKASVEVILKKSGNDAFEAVLKMKEGEIDVQATTNDLGQWWADCNGLAYVELSKSLFQPGVVQKLPKDFSYAHTIIPLYQFGDAVTVAVADVSNKDILKEAGELMGAPASPVFSFPDEIQDALAIQYQTENSIEEITSKISGALISSSGNEATLESIKEIAGDKAIVDLVQSIFLLGLKEGASDIHIEPYENRVNVRFRIDGILYNRMSFGKSVLPPLISRLKILSNTNITENRRPQDGRISFKLSSRSIDVRFATMPTIFGEKITLRILGRALVQDVPGLDELSLSAANRSKLEDIIRTPNGVIFVTGPTGSGKTTTLFSILNQLNEPETNILTVEDPVEYRLEGITQVQVNAAIDLDFAKVLRSFLRHDPDIILVGEIRDLETAKVASQAALTGHLVMATMHTNNSLQAITRLVEIGVEPFLVAPSVIGVVAQRLVRKICEQCKEKYEVDEALLNETFLWDGMEKVYFYRGRGCEKCKHSGYSGRIALHEILIVDEQVRDFIAKSSSILEVKKYVESDTVDFQTLRYDGLKKVLRGLTTIDEINKTTPKELKVNF
ncbi:MAG: type II/IV secretion system protein [Candidatus Nitrohelix vancouverensis]|uniref:Type II/IV secretion system protein n=1 Tax=Candidatus Nitrohelix vancouverensis TaxID=2705534 RepID=A0A7T0G2L1_9BACT|nr:MAG: type II/IV secretion system protein [Candidatus Nitrohelix vancouverensis]